VEIFSDWMGFGGAGEMLMRWGHYLAGVCWIGLLYYFNFVQTPAFTEVSDSTRSEALRHISWRALWWFRFAALLTFATGVLILGFQRALGSDFDVYWTTPQGLSITMGAIFATTMFLNVWLVIWPKQQIVIGSARRVAEGGEPDPDAAAAGKPAARASRANTLMSIPMLWYMGFTSHFASRFGSGELESSDYWGAFIVFIVVWLFIELSALGKLGGYDAPQAKLMFDDHRNTIIAGFVAWAVLHVIAWEILLG